MNDDAEREPSDLEPGDLNPGEPGSNNLDAIDSESGDAELIARLRAADPAAGVEPRAGFADEVLARTLAEPTAASATGTASTPVSTPVSAPVSDLSAERARRRPIWLPLVAVAASLVLVGGAGFGIGASMSGATITSATNTAEGAAPPVTLQSGTGVGGADSGMGTAAGSSNQPGQGMNTGLNPQSKLSAGMSADYNPNYGFGRNSFSSSGLSSKDGVASVYAFDARSSSNSDSIQTLATSLGLTGTPEKKDGAWQVGAVDGTGPALWVGIDGNLRFYFTNPTASPTFCGIEVESCGTPGPLPSEDAAISALRSFIESVGRDPGTFEYSSADTWEGSTTRNAQASPIVDGKRIDETWSLELAEGGIASATGTWASIVPLGDYPIISAQDGFKRLSDPRFGAQMGMMPMAARAQTDIGPTEWVPPTEPPATPAAGTSVSWPVNKVDIVSARLGLASQWQPDGSVLVVPAYEFTDADGGTWSIIAVADSKLDFATN